MNPKPTLLILHNKYLQKGGEDTVVQNEISILQTNGYTVYYKEFNNQDIHSLKPGILLMPLNFFFNFASFFQVYFLVKKHKIQVVHVHNFFYTASPSVFWAAKAAGAATVITVHNYRLFCLNGYFFKKGETCFQCHTKKSFSTGIHEKCFRSSAISSNVLALSTNFHRKIHTWKNKVDQFIVINPFMPQLLQDIGIPAKKIFVKPNFLATQKTESIPDYRDRDDFYLFVGRLSEEKGIRQLILAFEKMQKKLVIAGDGDLRNFVIEHTSPTIQYKGLLPKEEITDLYTSCKALVFPSLWIEGMPMTIIEAQSSGAIPIVASSVTTEKIVDHGVNGFLYTPGNEADLLSVIDLFESLSIESLNTLSKNVQAHFLKTHSSEQHTKAITAIYSKLSA